MNDQEDLAQCIYCNEFKTLSSMHVVFKTGFAHSGGVSYPLGVCARCHETGHDGRTRPVHAQRSE